jgi:hypothetical protein
MTIHLTPKNLLLGMVAVSLFCLLLFGGYFGYVLVRDRQSTLYPGALALSSHDVFKLSPYLYYRSEMVYRTGDSFVMVYHWYAHEFSLGPQTQGQSNCISIFSTETMLYLTKVMTVTLCDSGNGRLIYTERWWRVNLP